MYANVCKSCFFVSILVFSQSYVVGAVERLCHSLKTELLGYFVPRAASYWLLTSDINLVFWVITPAHRGKPGCLFFLSLFFLRLMIQSKSVIAGLSNETNSATQSLDQRPVCTQQNSDDMSKRAKAKSLLKLKLKTMCKPSEIYHFPVNTTGIHRRLLG